LCRPLLRARPDLPGGYGRLADELAELAHALGDVGAGLLPRRPEPLAVLLDVGAPRVGELVDGAALARLAADQALVREELEGGVDRAGARPPRAAGPLPELL